VRDGDVIRLCAASGAIDLLMNDAEFLAREPAQPPVDADGSGRELFALFRHSAGMAETGASPILSGAGL
jgi:phosphogluconate dehydratase